MLGCSTFPLIRSVNDIRRFLVFCFSTDINSLPASSTGSRLFLLEIQIAKAAPAPRAMTPTTIGIPTTIAREGLLSFMVSSSVGAAVVSSFVGAAVVSSFVGAAVVSSFDGAAVVSSSVGAVVVSSFVGAAVVSSSVGAVVISSSSSPIRTLILSKIEQQ